MGVPNVITVSHDLDVMAFATADELWSWPEQQPATHAGIWVRLQKVGSDALRHAWWCRCRKCRGMRCANSKKLMLERRPARVSAQAAIRLLWRMA